RRVAAHRHDVPAEPGAGGGEAVRVAAGDQHPGAAPGQESGGGEPETAGAASDHDVLARVVAHGSTPVRGGRDVQDLSCGASYHRGMTSDLDLRLVRYFTVVAEHGNFGRAAA